MVIIQICLSIRIILAISTICIKKLIDQTISLLKLFISFEVLNDNNDTTSPSKAYFPFGTNMLYLQNIHNLSNFENRNNNGIDKESFTTSGNGISINEYRLYKLYYSIKMRFDPYEIN